MSPRVLALALVLALAGCKKKEAAPAGDTGATGATDVAPAGPMDPLVAEVHDGLKKFRTQMCECQDVACADKVQLQLGGWIMTNKDRFTDVDQKSTPEHIAAAKKISAEHNACAAKLVQQ